MDDPRIASIEYDSRQVRADSLFCAVEGQKADGHRFLDEVVRKGAVAVASERPAPENFPLHWIRVSDIRAYMAVLANEYYGRPSEQMQLIGITGTNGKTTTAFLAHSILQMDGPSLLIGTIKTSIGLEEWDSERTTPESVDIQRALALALSKDCTRGVLEVSSHALAFNRVYDCHFPVAVFTNLSQDHLDFHGTMEDYFQTKKLLFDPQHNPGIRHAILNGDDPMSRHIAAISAGQQAFFGFRTENDIYPLSIHLSEDGIDMELFFLGRTLRVRSPLIGKHNCYNIMAAAAACSRLGIPDYRIAKGISRLKSVPGRLERVPVDAPFQVFVDYAHTPHALENVLNLCRSVARGRVICVFGCGGDRDRKKRPLMGRIATELADRAILTTDNPRFEEPVRILDEIQEGIPPGLDNYEVIVDRRTAIFEALKLAQPNDFVLIAGKGHEAYQEIRGEKYFFDDREVVKEWF